MSKLEVDACTNASSEANPQVLNYHESFIFDWSLVTCVNLNPYTLG